MRRRTSLNAERTRGDDVGARRLVERHRGDHGGDRLLGIGRSAEREQTIRAVLFDGAPLVGRVIAGLQLVEQRQRVLVFGGGVQIARRGQRIGGAHRNGHQRRNQQRKPMSM